MKGINVCNVVIFSCGKDTMLDVPNNIAQQNVEIKRDISVEKKTQHILNEWHEITENTMPKTRIN